MDNTPFIVLSVLVMALGFWIGFPRKEKEVGLLRRIIGAVIALAGAWALIGRFVSQDQRTTWAGWAVIVIGVVWVIQSVKSKQFISMAIGAVIVLVIGLPLIGGMGAFRSLTDALGVIVGDAREVYTESVEPELGN